MGHATIQALRPRPPPSPSSRPHSLARSLTHCLPLLFSSLSAGGGDDAPRQLLGGRQDPRALPQARVGSAFQSVSGTTPGTKRVKAYGRRGEVGGGGALAGRKGTRAALSSAPPTTTPALKRTAPHPPACAPARERSLCSDAGTREESDHRFSTRKAARCWRLTGPPRAAARCCGGTRRRTRPTSRASAGSPRRWASSCRRARAGPGETLRVAPFTRPQTPRADAPGGLRLQ